MNHTVVPPLRRKAGVINLLRGNWGDAHITTAPSVTRMVWRESGAQCGRVRSATKLERATRTGLTPARLVIAKIVAGSQGEKPWPYPKAGGN